LGKYQEHIPVLLDHCRKYLFEERGQKNNLDYMDITLGGGGHLRNFLESYNISSVTALDQDPDAIEHNQDLLKSDKAAVSIIHTNFHEYLDKSGEQLESSFDVILGDLGVSSHHFDSADRGFSFRFDAELDMRMNTTRGYKASDILREYTKEELLELLFTFGEEKFAHRIVDRILEQRGKSPITMTKQLEEICYLSYPKSLRYKKTHPATKTFQALRIEVNREFEVLELSLPILFNCLKPGGRLGIISFHSSEDRIVKHGFKKIYTENKDRCKIVTKKPIVAGVQEVEQNPRARSAKLRVIEKLVL